MSLARAIRLVRQRRGLSQQALAEAAGLPSTAVTFIENAGMHEEERLNRKTAPRTRDVSIEELIRIAMALDTTVTALLLPPRPGVALPGGSRATAYEFLDLLLGVPDADGVPETEWTSTLVHEGTSFGEAIADFRGRWVAALEAADLDLVLDRLARGLVEIGRLAQHMSLGDEALRDRFESALLEGMEDA